MTEFFDIVDEAGQPTGKIISRVEAHQKGTLHRTAHVWLVKSQVAMIFSCKSAAKKKTHSPACMILLLPVTSLQVMNRCLQRCGS